MTRRSITTASFLVLALGVALFASSDHSTEAQTTPVTDPGQGTSVERAEALVAEGSYGLAHEAFVELDGRDLGAEVNRWVDFRLADTLWRSLAATETPDRTEIERARQELETFVREISREADRDRVWVEAQESLGDFSWTGQRHRNWGQAWPHYQQALEWWAKSRDIDVARDRYLKIVWKSARPPRPEPYYYYGYHGNQLPDNVLRNVLRITDDPDHRARAHFLIAMNLRWQGGNQAQMRRTAEAFEAALEPGRRTNWYDDALYHYAEWLTRSGRAMRLEGGGWQQQPDYVRALELFRRMTSEFAKGETRYYDQAKSQIETISTPRVGVAVPEIFLPGSVVRYQLSWRNVKQLDLALFPVDLTQDVRWDRDSGSGQWLQRIVSSSREAARSWSWQTNDRGLHMPGTETLNLDDELPPGAYVLEASADGTTARELVLVTAASMVLKTSGTQGLAYVCDAISGAPRGNAEIVFWTRTYDNVWSWHQASTRTDADGLARIELPDTDNHVELFVAAADGAHQAFAYSSSYNYRQQDHGWKLYVFTDRPAYRPGEKAGWKVVARRLDGATYRTPSSTEIRYEITDPRGAKIEEGSLELNRFGSGWGETALSAEQPLGEYRVTFRDPSGNRTIGGAVLLRLEEYKLPEFRVEVRPPEEDGRPRALRVGDPVEAEISAEYYFGGAVADATAEVLVYRKPLWIHWQPPREFPWFYEDMMQRRHGRGGPGQIVHQETLKTDAAGRATLRFEPPFDASQDFEYTIEARVTDASRREIVGRGTVRASRQRYFAFLQAAHNLHRPGDEIRLTIKTVDAGERPYRAEGQVRITRDRWVEVWIDPAGRELRGDALERARRRDDLSGPGWRMKHNGYEHEEVLSRRVTTDEDGQAELSFTPSGDGFYRVRWSGDDEELFPVTGETTVWVADPDSVNIGYRSGGVQILVDSETMRAGRTAPVMLSVPAADSWVLFSVEGDDLLDYRVVHMTGTVKLLELEVEEKHVPNIFLDAAMVRDGELFTDSRQVVVPPVDHFLEVEVVADRGEYRPREKGILTVTTRDHEGNPVPAEVALALVDESVFYIQKDYAGDPRQFFYGTKRSKRVMTRSSFHVRRYRQLLQDKEEGEWTDGSRADGGASGMFSADLAVPGRMERAKKSAMGMVMMEADEVMAQAPAPSAAPAEEIAGGETGAVEVRSDFRSTALWKPDVVTGDDGTARVEVSFPDSLTTWKATARAATAGNRFGRAESATRTAKPLIVRLQAPRFFVVGDRAVVSAIVNNNSDDPLDVDVSLEAEGLALLDAGDNSVRVDAGGEIRLDWTVSAREAGAAKLTVAARGGSHDDAMTLDYPVHEHGIEKFLSRSGKVRGDEIRVSLDLPREHREGSTSMSVQVTPSLAVTMLDALPYLIDYPYGCTEQTMSRFLPSVITSRTLESFGLRPREIAGRIFGGIERQHAAATHPDGVRDLKKLDEMVHDGLRRLYDFQHGDGGWGWWKEGSSDHFMTAYVVWGLGLARDAGIRIDAQVLRRGVEFLQREIVEEEQRPHLQAWMLHALSTEAASRKARPTKFQQTALDNLWERRDGLNAYSRSLLALSAHHMGDAERAQVLVRNLVNGVKRDRSPDTSVVMRGAQKSGRGVVGTAHWGADGLYWRWADGPVEATSFALRALLAIDPENELIEPVTNWLIKNRRGAQWSNTRDTAIAVLALSDYLRTSGELGSEIEFEVWVNGRKVAAREVGPDDVLGPPSRFEIEPGLLLDGENEVRIVRTGGDGALYFSADLRYFSL